MNNIIKRVWVRNRMVNIDYLGGSAFYAEDGGHTFQISGAESDGSAVALSGTVAGVFLRPDNTDVAITGSCTGGVVSVTLPANCYDVQGRFGLTIFLTEGEQKTAIYAAVGNVARTSSGTVAPQTTADVVDLINRISAAVATIPQSWTGLMADIAPTYSASAVYPAGAYVYYNGDLYRCTTAITTAETWTPAHWTTANLGTDLRDLKAAVNNHSNFIIIDNWNAGHFYSNGTKINTIDINNPSTNANYSCMAIPCSPGEVFEYIGESSNVARSLSFLSSADGNDNKLTASNYVYPENSSLLISAPQNAQYVVVNKKNSVSCLFVKHIDAKILAPGESLNNCLDVGTYYALTSSVATQVLDRPVELNTSFLMEVKSVNYSGSSRMQIISSGTTEGRYVYVGVRYYTSGGGFSDWFPISEGTKTKQLEIKELSIIPDNTDLDMVVDVGSYYCVSYASAITIKNTPLLNASSFFLYVLNSNSPHDTTWKRQVLFGNKIGSSVIYTRIRNASGWSQWEMLNTSRSFETPKTIKESTYIVRARLHGEPLKTIRVGTNNVAHYWLSGINGISGSDNGVFLSAFPVRIATWRNWLLKSNLDLLFLQECENWIDRDKHISAFDTLYKPFFDSDTNVTEDGTTETGGTIIDSSARRKILNRLGLDTNSIGVTVPTLDAEHSRDAYYSYKFVTIEDVGVVLLINIHPISGSSQYRLADRVNFFDEISTFIRSSEFDYFIIAGDFNSATDDDLVNIMSFCETVGATPVNGGVSGWFATHSTDEGESPLDNILVSNNIRIDSIECDPILVSGNFIHTDHNPITATISFMPKGS